MGLDSRLQAGFAYLREHGLEPAFAEPPELGLSRRRSITVRTTLAEVIGIDATASGTGAVVARTLPSWRQLAEIVHLARGAR